MKFLIKLILFIGIISISQTVNAQFLDRIARKTQQKIEREAENRTQRKIDKEIDKAFDEAEDEIDGKNKKDEKPNSTSDKNEENSETSDNSNDQQVVENENTTPTLVWNKYDFIPGDTVIFEDGPSNDEENGEFPSRWDLHKGNIEIGEFGGEKVIMFLSNQSYMVPYLKNSNEDYIPDVFTIEFDVWFSKGSSTANRLWVYLGDQKNNRTDAARRSLVVMPHSLEFGESEKDYPGTENIGWTHENEGAWKHISIAYTKGKYKAYFNDTRLINIPHLDVNPTGITIEAGNDNMYLKNIRIAKGGVKYYDRVLSEGKIIVNGIKFDVNKATLKPESMGPINKIYKLMVKNPDLNFSVEGHTDSDGSDQTNMTLSKKRAKTVMNQLIEMGIDASRLKSTGFGENKPIDNNTTSEGKANNRRVEFVKF